MHIGYDGPVLAFISTSSGRMGSGNADEIKLLALSGSQPRKSKAAV